MLQQILRDLYIDPDILSGLDEEQKQILFCKMREEQIRRWTLWDQKVTEENPITPPPQMKSNNRKSVSFMEGVDGAPWVWVMGEHENDLSIEDILQNEAREKARELAEKEANEMRKAREKEIELMDLNPKIEDLSLEQDQNHLKINQNEDIYCSVDELRDKINNNTNKPKLPIKKNSYVMSHYQNKSFKFSVIDRNEMNKAVQPKVAQKVELWEKRLTEERTSEIFKKIQKKQLEAKQEAEEAEKKQEELWKEQERKAKEAELQIREIARRAREEHRLTAALETSYSTVVPPAGVPPTRQAVIDWYKNQEVVKKTGLDDRDEIEPWFHGLITRVEAEKLLHDQPDGSYLVRLSERIWGYAVSYKAKEKCKHYLVHANGSYSFLGNNQIEHKTLGGLISHHINHPLSGGEKLVKPCPRLGDETLKDLF